MAKKPDSTTLFVAQVCNHAEELAGLLATSTMEPIEPGTIERIILSTNMLSHSSSLMELNGLQAFLRSFEELLKVYRDKNLPWDERIAQLTSEIIEREDHFVESSKGKPQAQLKDIITPEELAGLTGELAELASFADSAQPWHGHVDTAASAIAEMDDGEPASGDATVTTPTGNAVKPDLPFGKSIGHMQRHSMDLFKRWESANWTFDQVSPEMFQQLRKELLLINFHALSVEQMIGIKTGDRSELRVDFLEPVGCAMNDFSSALRAGTNRRIDIGFIGKDNLLDVRLLSPVVRVLQRLIGDIFLRCQEEYLRVEIVVQEQNGALIWSLRDNGRNFIADSIDADEYLAFYPGLRETCRILSKLHSLLWVEPDEKQQTRFAFSIPLSPETETFMVWGPDDNAFALLSHQVSDVLAMEAEIHSDARGEYVNHGGTRIPLVRLDQVYEGAPGAGNRVAVIGYLEKRIALLVDGSGKIMQGHWLRDAVPSWRGLTQGVAELGAEKIPLVEANALLNHYLAVINDTGMRNVAGGTLDEDPGLSAIGDGVMPPVSGASPDTSKGHVLVVERSEALRNAFASILSQKKLKAKLVDQIDAAIDCLEEEPPWLIISEFRVPSMAAKVLVEKLKAEGIEIPVLVTTTHDGENAELLVKKLGVAGFISKPIDSAQVVTRIEGFLEREHTGAPKA